MRSGLVALLCLGQFGCQSPVSVQIPSLGEKTASFVIARRCDDELRIDARDAAQADLFTEPCSNGEVTVIEYLETLSERQLPAGRVPPGRCDPSRLSLSRCCTSHGLLPAHRVWVSRIGAEGPGPFSESEAPADVLSFRYDGDCPCRPFDLLSIRPPFGSRTRILPIDDERFAVFVRDEYDAPTLGGQLVEIALQDALLGRVDWQGGTRLDFDVTQVYRAPDGELFLAGPQARLMRGRIETGFTPDPNPALTNIRSLAGSDAGATEVVALSASGDLHFFRDGMWTTLGPPPPSDQCRDSFSLSVGQLPATVWLGPGSFLAAPPFLPATSDGRPESAPGGYWRFDRGQIEWHGWGLQEECTSAISATPAGLVRATSRSLFFLGEAGEDERLPIVDGPSGVTTFEEVRAILPFDSSFVFVGKHGSFGAYHSGLLCELITTGLGDLRQFVEIGGVFVAGVDGDYGTGTNGVFLFRPRP